MPEPVPLVTLALFLAACASGTPEPAPSEGSADAVAPATAKPAPPEASASAGEPTQRAPHAREIMRKDCEALAQKYGALVVSDEMAKLSPKLTDAQRESARSNLEKGAKTLADRFSEGCAQSLVGKFADEASLQCAMGSKSIAAFDICMNGPSTPPP